MLKNIPIENIIETYLIPWGTKITLALLIFIIGRFVAKILVNFLGKVLKHAKFDDILTNFTQSIVSSVLLLFIIVASLDQLGVNTTSIVALLGAAGLAVGLSLQGSLQNFAAGVMLLIFRPFKAGDFIEAAGVSGVVETISIFSSIIRTGDNKEIIVPNGSIYGGNIINYSARDTRRVDMVFGIGYNDDLLKAKTILNELLAADERILEEPAPLVAVAELADSSVNFNVRPWVKSGDYWGVFYDFHEKTKLRFDKEGISIPYPQMDVHLDQEK